MVVIAQLAEHRIVVPSVVGSSPTLHPRRESFDSLFCFPLTRAYTRSYYIYYTGTPFLSASVGWSTPIFSFSPFCPQKSQKIHR